jgi:hypothetical protein
MTSHRKISSTTVFVAALLALAPAFASANSLLSGYGGPGAGNQAILGSALIGGGGGATGGSSGSGGSTGSTGASSGSVGAAGTGESDAVGGNGRGVEAGATGKDAEATGVGGQTGGGAADSRRGHGRASGGAARAYPVRPLDDGSQSATEGSGALGFSAADLGYLLLALAVLGATGIVTRRLARAPTPPEGLR